MSRNNDKSDSKLLKEVLEADEIPFMHYGIINRFNFSTIEGIPIKRWDPLSYISISDKKPNNNIIIKQNNYGHYSYISPIRATRPIERGAKNNKKSFKESADQRTPESNDPIDIFEPMLTGKHFISKLTGRTRLAHAIVISDGEKKMDDPFSDTVKIHSNLKGRAVSMINKYPAMIRVIDPEIYPIIIRNIEQRDKNSDLALGICLLTIPKTYYEKIEDIPATELRDLFLSMNTAIRYCTDEAFKQKVISNIPISPFFNIGKPVGGSLRRIHAQTYLDLSQDGHGSRMEGILKAFEKMKQKHLCQVCTSTHEEGKRTIFDNDEWTVFATGSPIRNYHLRFAPKSHIENLYDVSASKFLSLSKILKVLFLALNDLGVNPNRNIVFNTKPHGYDDVYFHIFGEIFPFEFVGGAEMADDMRVIRVSPKKVAKSLREIIKSKYEDLL
ncbi:MAG: hypothetical protein ACTSWY_13735 [Promethearchaeota archaeon]